MKVLMILIFAFSTITTAQEDIVRLEVGDNSPKFKVEDVRGSKVKLKDILKENKVLMVFLRHAWCPVCNYRTHELIKNYDKLKEKGYEVVVVYESNKTNLLSYVNDYDLPYKVISDPTGDLYYAYKVERSREKMKKSMQNPKVQEHYQKGKELFDGKEYAMSDGEDKSAIIPADFIIAQDGTIEEAYYGKFIGDHLPVADILNK